MVHRKEKRGVVREKTAGNVEGQNKQGLLKVVVIVERTPPKFMSGETKSAKGSGVRQRGLGDQEKSKDTRK